MYAVYKFRIFTRNTEAKQFAYLREQGSVLNKTST